MSVWYRVTKNESKVDSFSGEGGLYTSGRWNYIGRKTVYCSESIALCTLEWLAHNGLSVSAFSYSRYSIEIEDNLIRKFTMHELPEDWQLNPATDSTREFAEKHLFSSERYLAIGAPSVMVPEEYNLVINVMHDQYRNVYKSIKKLGRFIAPKRT